MVLSAAARRWRPSRGHRGCCAADRSAITAPSRRSRSVRS